MFDESEFRAFWGENLLLETRLPLVGEKKCMEIALATLARVGLLEEAKAVLLEVAPLEIVKRKADRCHYWKDFFSPSLPSSSRIEDDVAHHNSGFAWQTLEACLKKENRWVIFFAVYSGLGMERVLDLIQTEVEEK